MKVTSLYLSLVTAMVKLWKQIANISLQKDRF